MNFDTVVHVWPESVSVVKRFLKSPNLSVYENHRY